MFLLSILRQVRKRLAAMEAKNFDPDRSARVRAKPESDGNFEERAWCVLDQCLNPGAWVGKDGRPIVSLLPPKAREADVTGFSLPFPLDSELAQELEDERKQKVIAFQVITEKLSDLFLASHAFFVPIH